MQLSRLASWAVAAAILGTLLLAGPVGGLDVTTEPARLGGGNATVVDVHIRDGVAIDAGRFGTDRMYVRGPTASVAVRSTRGSPRLVLRTEVPALGYDAVATRLLDPGTQGRVRLRTGDGPFPREAIDFERATVRTTVRVQSFDGNWVVFARNRTVEVRR